MKPKLKPIAEQIIVITGSSSGIGLATAQQAARRGAAVVLVARNQPALEEIRNDLTTAGGRAAICAIDIADETAPARITDIAIQEFGGFDTWVNCASVSDYGTLEQIGVTEHRRVFETNYFSVLQCSLAALAHLRTRGGGAIVNVGSILSDRAIIAQGPYSASKHAVLALTDTLRMEMEREGLAISVTLIKPAGIHTPFPEHARNHMDAPPRVPQIVYAPELAAGAILFAAEHPRRQLYVGGSGFIGVKLANLFPRLTDRIMETVAVRAQQSPEDPGDPAARDNLYQPAKDGDVHGSQDIAVRDTSLFLEGQKRPLVASALLLAGVIGLAASLRGSALRSGSHAATSRPRA